MEQQPTPTESSGESQEKIELEEQVKALSQQSQKLAIENYMNSLGDEKIFRLEILQSLAKISQSLENLNQTISIGLSQELEEENPETDVEEESKEDIPDTKKKV